MLNSYRKAGILQILKEDRNVSLPLGFEELQREEKREKREERRERREERREKREERREKREEVT